MTRLFLIEKARSRFLYLALTTSLLKSSACSCDSRGKNVKRCKRVARKTDRLIMSEGLFKKRFIKKNLGEFWSDKCSSAHPNKVRQDKVDIKIHTFKTFKWVVPISTRFWQTFLCDFMKGNVRCATHK